MRNLRYGGLLWSGLVIVACTSGSDGGPPGTDPPPGPKPVPGYDASTSDARDGATSSVPQKCKANADCPSFVCDLIRGECLASTCSDGVLNQNEGDTDCGGPCAPCDVLKKCHSGSDCASLVCEDTGAGLQCQPPSSRDGVRNGTETGTDCGGLGNAPCATGQGCQVRSDCVSDVCVGGKCIEPVCSDGMKNGTETGTDCGGPSCPRCGEGAGCTVKDDCQSSVCLDTGAGLQCQAPSPTDGTQNGAETDVDCGGGGANPACAVGLTCSTGTDCLSQGCDYTLHCAAGRSCTAHYGGDTCGLGGDIGPSTWESCCATASVTPTAGPTRGQAVALGKYPVTSGRMRVFLESIGYDVRGFVQATRSAGKMPTIPGDSGRHDVLDANWDMYLPTSFDGNTSTAEIADCTAANSCPNPQDGECPASTTCQPGTQEQGLYTGVRKHLGGIIFKGNQQKLTGCFVGSPGTHSFRFPKGAQDGDEPEQEQPVYDTKTLNCVDYLLGQAFCVWDGGRLELLEEWQSAWGPGAVPWSATTPLLPATPATKTLINPDSCTVDSDCCVADDGCTDPTIYACTNSTCVLAKGSATYWGCRFPWATGPSVNCNLTWDTSTRSIEIADYLYSYEYPKLADTAQDYIVFLTAPGRTFGRGPSGHSDLVGAGFELTSSVTWAADVFTANHRWTGNGSWEVHSYDKTPTRKTSLLNKYGKLGLRCAYP